MAARVEYAYSTYNKRGKTRISEKQIPMFKNTHVLKAERKWPRRVPLTTPRVSTGTRASALTTTSVDPRMSIGPRASSISRYSYGRKSSYNETFRRLSKYYMLQPEELRKPELKNMYPPRKAVRTEPKQETQKPENLAAKNMILTLLDILQDYELECAQDACAQGPCLSSECDTKPKRRRFEIPHKILSKYKQFQLPQNIKETRKLLRPKIYFDVELLHYQNMGRIVVELYTEACPAVVLEFARCCRNNYHDRFNLTRSFPLVWLEAELELESDDLCQPDIEYDMRALSNGADCGILSFAGRHVNGFKNGVLSFSFSYNKLPKLNGTRVAFGVVTSGLDILKSIQDFDISRCDLKSFCISKCGLLTC